MLESNEKKTQKTEEEEQREILESIFGNASDEAFDADNQWAATEGDTPERQGLPDAPKGQPVEEEHPQDNDNVRYQYWQSEAQKKESELSKARAEIDYYKKLSELSQSNKVEPEPKEDERFPDPPQQPRMPAGYNVEDALNNPQSPSYAYAQEYQEWQNNMLEYQTLKTQYLEAVMNERFDEINKEKQAMAERRKQEMAYNEQIGGIRKEVMQKYGVGPDVADDFIQKMSDPQSLSIDNLFKLYQVAFGGGTMPTNQPTEDFKQAKVAEGFGPGFNKLPSGTSTIGKSPEDQIFDAMLAQEKKRTDW